MIQRISKNQIRGRIHTRIRHRVRGTAERPRLAVYRSLGHIYAQLIDDMQGQTLVAAASSEKALRAAATEAGKDAAAKGAAAKAEAAKGAAAKSAAAETAKPETAKADADKSAKGETSKAETVKRASVKADAGIAPKTGSSEKTPKGAEKGAKGEAEKSAKPDSEKSGAKGKSAKPENTKVSGGNLAGAQLIGKTIADRAKQKGIKKVVFDRGGYLYHGRIKALADAAREAGLEF